MLACTGRYVEVPLGASCRGLLDSDTVMCMHTFQFQFQFQFHLSHVDLHLDGYKCMREYDAAGQEERGAAMIETQWNDVHAH